MNRVPDHILLRLYLLFGGFVIFAIAILTQVVRIQYFQGKYWKELEQKERIVQVPVKADRGNILADDGSILATSLPYYRIGMDAKAFRRDSFLNFNDSLEVLSQNLAYHFGTDERDARYFRERILSGLNSPKLAKAKYLYIPLIPEWINYEELKMVTSWPLLNRGRFISGLVIDKKQQRFYPYQQLGRMTLGLVTDSAKAIRGIEYAFDKELRGMDGLIMAQKLAGNTLMPLDRFGQKLTTDGYDVQTTLNINMMDIVRDALKNGVENNEAKFGVAILMETKTGQIKALANYPEEYNYAVALTIEPGSTFKVASAIALLEDKKVKPQDTVDTGDGTIKYFDKVITDHHRLGKITFETAIAQSSNVAISKLVQEHYKDNPELFIQHLERMHLLETTGISLKGEPEPIIVRPGNKEWSGTSLPSLSYGYGIRMTPLQLLSFYNAIANGGKIVQPMLVKSVRDKSHLFQEFETEENPTRIASEETLAQVRKMMEAVVESGTAKDIRSKDFKIAGKTGTVRKLVNGQYQAKYRASFIGYFPAENPKYTCLVMIDEPSVGEQYYGSQVAAPVFREIASNLFATDLDLNQEDFPAAGPASRKYPVTRLASADNILSVYNALNIPAPTQPEGDWVRGSREGSVVKLASWTPKKEYVPDVNRMSSRDAVALLENLGLKVKLMGHGRVRRQSLMSGTVINRKNPQTIILELN
jgi:cell division protein FtsI (penicillin-binding protein 3)